MLLTIFGGVRLLFAAFGERGEAVMHSLHVVRDIDKTLTRL